MRERTTNLGEQHNKQPHGLSLGHFSVFIPEALSFESGYARMVHCSKYSLVLRNDNRMRCDAVVMIDGQEVGRWRINASAEIRLERPSHDTGCFTFYRLGTSESAKAQISDNDQAGLITVDFIPERAVQPTGVRYQRELPESGGTGLSGRSDQEFTKVAALNYDWQNQVTIHLRLIAGEDEPRPLKPRATAVPPRVD